MLNKALLFIMAVCTGSLLSKLHIPIPFLLGGMLTALLCKMIGRGRVNVEWPKRWRGYGLMISGYGIGATFNEQSLQNFIDEMAGVVEANVIAIGVSVLLAVIIARRTRFNLESCVMGMMPGGITLMMLLTEQYKRANPNAVMVMQILRLFGVIVTVPFLVIYCLDAKIIGSSVAMPNLGGMHWLVFVPLTILGGYIATKVHMPTPQLLGAILMTALFSVEIGQLQPVPGWLMGAAQISIGLYMGQLLDAEKLAQTRELLPYTLLGTAILIIISIGVAYMLAAQYGFSLVTAFLAMAPGGIAEMALAGMSMGENVSLILTYQMVRVLAINILVPPILAWYFKEK